MPELLIVLSTFPDEPAARQIGTTLVERNLAACVNIVPAITSIYRWEGKTHTDPEVLAIIKTTPARYQALEKDLADLHPYDTPEIVALPPSNSLPAYAAWVSSNTTPP